MTEGTSFLLLDFPRMAEPFWALLGHLVLTQLSLKPGNKASCRIEGDILPQAWTQRPAFL